MAPDHKPAATVTIPAGELRTYARDILIQLGAHSAAAAEVADHLIAADLAGVRSHGVALLPWYDELISTGQVHPQATFEVLEDKGAAVSIDGHFGLGQVCANAAVEMLIDRARRNGLACATGKNAGHIGRLGHYTTEFARHGLIGMVVINYQGADQDVAPFGGREGRLSNDPLSIGAPEILFPGEPEARETARQLATGVEIERVDWDRLVPLGDRLGIAAPAP